LARSSNVGAAKIGRAVGRTKLAAGLKRFGLGEKTGVGFPGETSGRLRPAQSWSEIGVATISFGHGVAMSALQLAAAYRALARGGEYKSPRIVHSHGDPRQLRHVVDARVAEEVTRMLEQAVGPGGTGSAAQVPGYRVAGKTGTAQKLDPVTGTYSNDKFMAVFAGYLPAEAPRAVVVVVVDEPQEAHTGGQVAAPVFARIAQATMQQLGVVPSASVLSQALERMRDQALEAEVRVLDLPATRVAPEGTLPSFVGLTARQAALALTGLPGWQIHLHGSGVVVGQEPAAGNALHGQDLQLRLTLQ
jgi:cell division protein FtsI (penicillin-binding protein 3)